MVEDTKTAVILERKLRLDSTTIQKALVMGQAIVDYSRENPFNLPIRHGYRACSASQDAG